MAWTSCKVRTYEGVLVRRPDTEATVRSGMCTQTFVIFIWHLRQVQYNACDELHHESISAVMT